MKARFSANKRKLEEKKKEYDIDQKMEQLREEEERAKEYRSVCLSLDYLVLNPVILYHCIKVLVCQ